MAKTKQQLEYLVENLQANCELLKKERVNLAKSRTADRGVEKLQAVVAKVTGLWKNITEIELKLKENNESLSETARKQFPKELDKARKNINKVRQFTDKHCPQLAVKWNEILNEHLFSDTDDDNDDNEEDVEREIDGSKPGESVPLINLSSSNPKNVDLNKSKRTDDARQSTSNERPLPPTNVNQISADNWPNSNANGQQISTNSDSADASTAEMNAARLRQTANAQKYTLQMPEQSNGSDNTPAFYTPMTSTATGHSAFAFPVPTQNNITTMPADAINLFQAMIQNQNMAAAATAAMIQQLNTRAESGSTSERTSTFRCKEIPLPKFQGDIRQYLEFRRTFQEVMNNSNISSLAKFHHLKDSLSGSALYEILDMLPSGNDYEEAWRLLDLRFDNKREVIEADLTSFLQAPDCKIKSEDLLEWLHRVRALVRNFDTNKVSRNDVIVWLALQKIPTQLQQDFIDQRGRKSDFPSLSETLEFIETKHATLRIGKAAQVSNDQENKKRYPGRSTTTNLTVGGEPNRGKCFICQDNHVVIECPEFTKDPNKEAFLRQQKICIFCIRHRYDFRNPCKSKSRLKCEVCSGQHVTAMHSNNAQSVLAQPRPQQAGSTSSAASEKAQRTSTRKPARSTVTRRSFCPLLLHS